MKWNLKSVTKETNHPFLNFYTLHYEVEKGGEKKPYDYFMASRHEKEDLLPLTKSSKQPDGVTIPCYYLDENGNISFLITKQFRPAIGSFVYSVPAGLLDSNDESVLSVAKREALEEAGAVLTDLEVLAPSGTLSSGLSDETNAIVLGRIASFEKKKLEEFEDIETLLVAREELETMLNDPSYFFSCTARLLFLYLLLRFPK